MKIGICAWVLPGDELDSFSMASKLGLDGIVIDFGKMREDNPLLNEECRQTYLDEAKKYSLQIPTLAVNALCDTSMTNRATIEDAKEILAEAVTVAASMGIPKLQLPSFYKSLIRSDEDLDLTIEVIKYACQLAATKGLVIGTENVMTIDQHRKFYEEVNADNLTTLYDTQNPWRMLNQDGVKIAEYLAPFVGELHAKDSDPSQSGFVALGCGDVRFNESMMIFAAMGFDGWIHLESSYDHGEALEEQVKQDVVSIKNLFKSQG